ncbi:hypothetical protein GWI33_011413 [Rhynchophorus ferrugineus]|uniref:Uncharacterized protein n=1 Tax=Rhynchophorus ferrugineus TaxID=354439 RepID=A0A834MN84_RHYFE|nr:hypothetical protein GWI33_011413 [Rhynchophorus ferrugineus]
MSATEGSETVRKENGGLLFSPYQFISLPRGQRGRAVKGSVWAERRKLLRTINSKTAVSYNRKLSLIFNFNTIVVKSCIIELDRDYDSTVAVNILIFLTIVNKSFRKWEIVLALEWAEEEYQLQNSPAIIHCTTNQTSPTQTLVFNASSTVLRTDRIQDGRSFFSGSECWSSESKEREEPTGWSRTHSSRSRWIRLALARERQTQWIGGESDGTEHVGIRRAHPRVPRNVLSNGGEPSRYRAGGGDFLRVGACVCVSLYVCTPGSQSKWEKVIKAMEAVSDTVSGRTNYVKD